MPIPTATTEAGPRRLLRDVVFEKMLAAIVDGTLEPGERLNDDQLVKWLGVSRTPVREAIAQLHTYGLVEIEANRFTRVSARDDVVYAEASQFLAGLHTLAREWGTSNLDTTTRKTLSKSIATARKQLKAHDLEGPGTLLDVQGELAKARRGVAKSTGLSTSQAGLSLISSSSLLGHALAQPNRALNDAVLKSAVPHAVEALAKCDALAGGIFEHG